MKIGVFGDSFADRTPYNPESPFNEDESWIAAMEEGGHKITTYGKTGTSTWYSYEQFMAHHEQFDHIIFCYSSLHRMHHLPEGLEDLSFLTSPDELYAYRRNKGLSKQQELEAVRILTGYIPNISVPFDLWIKQKIFNDINLVCYNKKIKLVNLLTFDDRKDKNTTIELEQRHGECLYNLFSVSKKELPTMGEVDNRWCHLSKENNQLLSMLMFESLMSNDRNIIDLYKTKTFIYNTEITKRYIIDTDIKNV
jgi:hypothetical protein